MSDNLEPMLPEATENQNAEIVDNSAVELNTENNSEPVTEPSVVEAIKEDIQVLNEEKNLEIEEKVIEVEETPVVENEMEVEEELVHETTENLGNSEVVEELPMKDYSMDLSCEEIVKELNELIHNHPVQTIGKHVEELKRIFNVNFGQLLKEAKTKFLEDGGEQADFHFEPTVQKEYNTILFEFKKQRQQYFNAIEKVQVNNLSQKLELIESLKDLIENGNPDTMYKKFRDIQTKWKSIGQVPREKYTDLWRTYQFHVERFYDLLHLSNELRDMDFKHNYDEKMKLVVRVEELAELDDVKAAFDELQILHRLWKEEIGPVSREHSEEVWNRFSTATNKIHNRRHEYYEVIKGEFEENLTKKESILEQLNAINQTEYKTHNEWQKVLNKVEKLRKEFIEIGRVPKHKDKEVWENFRETNRVFNIAKNVYYKDVKKDQMDNLDKKMKLVAQAEGLRESEDWENATEIMKRIQSEWKTIGHVPKMHSDKIWNRFKEACNFYFDKLHKAQDANNEVQMSVYTKKKEYLEALKLESEKEGFKPDIEQLKKYIAEWKELGAVPQKQRYIEGKFNKFLDPYFENLSSDRTQSMMMRYKNMIDTYLEQKDSAKLNEEIQFVRKKIENVSKEKQQMETNRLYFSNADDNNPMIRKILNEIDKLSLELNVWESKLQYLRTIDF